MENNVNQAAEGAAEENLTGNESQAGISVQQIDEIKQKLRLEQNLGMSIGASALAAIVGALLWAFITVATKYQIGYMAVAVGFLVGFANRYAGKGLDQVFGIVGAVFALLGCVLGNYLTVIGLIANELGNGYFEAFQAIPFSLVVEVMKEDFGVYEILFYGLALYEGYKFSFRQVTEDDMRRYM